MDEKQMKAARAMLAALLEIETICTESTRDCRKRMGTRVGNSLVAARAARAAAEAAGIASPPPAGEEEKYWERVNRENHPDPEPCTPPAGDLERNAALEEAARYLCANFGRHTWVEADESVKNYYRAGIDGIVSIITPPSLATPAPGGG